MTARQVITDVEREQFSKAAMYCLQMAAVYKIVAPGDRICAQAAIACLQRSRGIDDGAKQVAEEVMRRVDDLGQAMRHFMGAPAGALGLGMLCLKTCYAALTGDANQSCEGARNGAAETDSFGRTLLGPATAESLLRDIGNLMRVAIDGDASLWQVQQADLQGVPAAGCQGGGAVPPVQHLHGGGDRAEQSKGS